MTTSSTPRADYGAIWYAKTDEQKVEWLATEVMQSRLGEEGALIVDEERNLVKFDWNPLTDWNHWRQVEEKVMENRVLCDAYQDELARYWKDFTVSAYISADLPTRARALFISYNYLHEQR